MTALFVLGCLMIGLIVVVALGWLAGVVVLYWRDLRSTAKWRAAVKGTRPWV